MNDGMGLPASGLRRVQQYTQLVPPTLRVYPIVSN